MPGGQTQATQQTQNTITNPWDPAQPMLKNILGNLGQGSLGATSGQNAAIAQLQNAASGIPSFGGAGTNAVNNMFNTSTAPQVGMLNNSFNTEMGALNPVLQPGYTNPMTAPGLGDALKTMNSDITNQINSRFAAAGRDLSPSNSQALARGLSQGEGGLLANEFNTLSGNQLNAAGMAGNAGINTAGAITGQNQIPLMNSAQGMTLAQMIPGLMTQPAMSNLGAAGLAAQSPYMNTQTIENLVNPIAALGGQSTGTMSGTTTQQTSPWGNIIGGVTGGLGLLGGTGAFGSAGWLAPLMLSDERLKIDKEKVGKLHDGQDVWSYRYVGDPTPRIGLMAQEVEKHTPEAVKDIGGGVKAVDYSLATRRARHIGMLADQFEMAA